MTLLQSEYIQAGSNLSALSQLAISLIVKLTSTHVARYRTLDRRVISLPLSMVAHNKVFHKASSERSSEMR